MEDLQGKVAFITGGASGIGLGIARAFSQAGTRIVIADARQDHLDKEFQEIFDEIIAALPEGVPDPGRLKNEMLRRQRKVDAMKSARKA